MLPIVIVFLAIVAVAIGVWGVTQSQAARSASVRADALEQRIQALESDLAAAKDRATFSEQAAKKAHERAEEQTKRAEKAERDARRSDEMAEDAVQRAIVAEKATTEARTRADEAEAARRAAEEDRDAVMVGAGPFQPEALWQMEVQRIERLWRDRLALLPGEVSPLAAGSHDIGAALKILAEASREESGVVVDLMWHVDFECPPDRCIQLVRLGEELVAAMRDSEGGELEVIGEEDQTVFFLLRTLPPVELPRPLIDVLDDFGAMREMADNTVVVRVPSRKDLTGGPPVPPAAGEAGSPGAAVPGPGQRSLFAGPGSEPEPSGEVVGADGTESARTGATPAEQPGSRSEHAVANGPDPAGVDGSGAASAPVAAEPGAAAGADGTTAGEPAIDLRDQPSASADPAAGATAAANGADASAEPAAPAS